MALFAGCGGGILGAKLLGWRTVCAVEIDAYRCERLAQRQNEGFLPPFPIWCGDIAAFDGRPWQGIADVVSGGFPCQDISAANPFAEGITGARSGLWKEMFRVVREVGPSCVLVENSPMLTGRGLGVVLSDLAALGYDARWGVLGADDLCGFHRRERLFLVGHANQARLERLAGWVTAGPRCAMTREKRLRIVRALWAKAKQAVPGEQRMFAIKIAELTKKWRIKPEEIVEQSTVGEISFRLRRYELAHRLSFAYLSRRHSVILMRPTLKGRPYVLIGDRLELGLAWNSLPVIYKMLRRSVRWFLRSKLEREIVCQFCGRSVCSACVNERLALLTMTRDEQSFLIGLTDGLVAREREEKERQTAREEMHQRAEEFGDILDGRGPKMALVIYEQPKKTREAVEEYVARKFPKARRQRAESVESGEQPGEDLPPDPDRTDEAPLTANNRKSWEIGFQLGVQAKIIPRSTLIKQKQTEKHHEVTNQKSPDVGRSRRRLRGDKGPDNPANHGKRPAGRRRKGSSVHRD